MAGGNAGGFTAPAEFDERAYLERSVQAGAYVWSGILIPNGDIHRMWSGFARSYIAEDIEARPTFMKETYYFYF